MMKFNKVLLGLLVCAFLVSTVSACTVFKVTAKDGTIISPRTMEFGTDLRSALDVVPRGMEFSSPAPDNKPGLKWNVKYGYVGIDAFGQFGMALDGLNEAGLAYSALWYEPDTKWQEVGPNEDSQALAHILLGPWILGNFATVGEVREGLKNIKVWGALIPEMGMAPPLHTAVYDAQGGCIVVEFDNGQMNVYDNPLGVMTNSPNFPWQVTNLRNYVNMSPEPAQPHNYPGLNIRQTGTGSGMLGLPGDITPPSRFVRIAVLTNFADKAASAKDALNLSRHIMNNVDIVKGTVIGRDKKGKIISSETTQWTSFRDLTNKVYYFNTYDNLTLRKIDLSRLEFKTPKSIALSSDEEMIIDKTDG
ncbi:MAG: choloylglycine hydrolase family protein [bacterium]